MKIHRIYLRNYLIVCAIISMIVACASIGSPDGGPYDETPPVFLKSHPTVNAVNYTGKRVTLEFDEYIKVEKAAEKVIVSPPQLQQPIIKTNGKKITVQLEDSIKENTTYTIDFSDAIVDNNEGNPLGNFAFTYSSGKEIDTLAISGTVLNAENLEPMKGLLVGIHTNLNDTAFNTLPFDRISRTDEDGRFTIRGIAPGTYRVYTLGDANQNYMFDQKNEVLGFYDSLVVPTTEMRIHQDTTWIDSLTIDTIRAVPHTHFLPEDIVIRAFTEKPTLRYCTKSERKELNKFSLYFSTPSDTLPLIEALNFDTTQAYIIEHTPGYDTIHYWLRDTMVYYQDTLAFALTYMATDTLGNLVPRTDTLELTPKKTRARILKENEALRKKEAKERAKRMKRGDTIPEVKHTIFLPMSIKANSSMDLYTNVLFSFKEPIISYNDSMIHLYKKVDTLWVDEPFIFRQRTNKILEYQLLGEWKPEQEYKLVVDSTAFTGLYGLHTKKQENKFSFKGLNQYSTLYLTVPNAQKGYTVQLLDSKDEVTRQAVIEKGHADFYFLNPGTYYIRLFNDRNANGIWDTGLYEDKLQAEEVYYFPGEMKLRENWDYSQEWNPTEVALEKQKPDKIKKQKSKEKKRKSKNAEREARKKKQNQ